MKTKVAAITIAAIALVSLCLAETISSSPKSSEIPTADPLKEIRAELKQTQTQLQQVVARTTALERQVRALEQANATLQQEVKNAGKPRLVPLESE